MAATGRALLLRRTSEKNFAEWVRREAARHGWCGWRVFHSEASVGGVHTTRFDGHSDSHGWPDWVFWKRGHRMIYAELKTADGRLSFDQKRLHADLAAVRDPPLVVVWRPEDEDLVRETFRRAA